MKFPAYIFRLIGVGMAAAVTFSCMTERNRDCDVRLSLCFTYTNNPEGTDLFADEVKDIYLYVFDERGYYVQSSVIDASSLGASRTIELPLDEGEYKFVAWGNLTGDDFDTEEDTDENADTRAVILKTDPNGVTNGSTADLFHGSASADTRGKLRERVVVDMTKNTNTINVLLKGVTTRTVSGTDISVRIASDNGAINFDNSTAARPVIYKPNYSKTSQGGENYDLARFKVMQLRVGDNTTIQLFKGGMLNTEESLTDLIRRHLPHIQTDEDFDRHSEYTFVYEYNEADGSFVLVGIGLADWDAPERPGGI